MEVKVAGDKMTIVLDLGKGTRSKSGRSLVAATTNGFVDVPGTEYKLSLNVIKPR